jgi:hypothetical protein
MLAMKEAYSEDAVNDDHLLVIVPFITTQNFASVGKLQGT